MLSVWISFLEFRNFIIPSPGDLAPSEKINIFTGESDYSLYSTDSMKKIFIPDLGETLIFYETYGHGVFMISSGIKKI